jgi:ubiquitin carboxyl-terminal hydrolase 35/38
MDQILTAMLRSSKPEAMKAQLVRKVISLGQQLPSNVSAMLSTCLHEVTSESDAAIRQSYKDVYLCWAEHNPHMFASFFTPAWVNHLLENASPDSLLLLEHSLVLMESSPSFLSLCDVVQKRAIHVVRVNFDFPTVTQFCILLSKMRHCIPQGTQTAPFCIAVIHAVSTFSVPKKEGYSALVAYVKGVSAGIGGLLQHVWLSVDDGCVSQCLHAILSIITKDSERDPSFALGGIVQFIPTRFVASITVATVAKDSDESLVAALGRMIDWLAWPNARNIHLWIIAFLKSLAAAKRYGVLIGITHDKIGSVSLMFCVVPSLLTFIHTFRSMTSSNTQ